MRKVLLSLLLGGLSTTAAFAQQEPDTDVFNGKWNVSIQPSSGRAQTAKLVLTNFAGTWVATAGPKMPKICSGKKLPVTVQVTQAATLEFTAWASQISPTCPDITVAVKPVNEKLLEGTLATGEAIKLSRP